MPNLKNAKKALRQSARRAVRNLEVKNTYKKAVKTARKAIEVGEKDLQETLRQAQKTLDKAAKRGVIKKNAAARKLSRIMKKAHATEKK